MTYNIVGYLTEESDEALVRVIDIPEEAVGAVMAAAISAHPYCRSWGTSDNDTDDGEDTPEEPEAEAES